MAEEEARHTPSVSRRYEGDGVAIGWEPALCIHSGNCVRLLPRTFVPSARPWVRMDAASADEIVATVRACPSGALTFERTDDAR